MYIYIYICHTYIYIYHMYIYDNIAIANFSPALANRCPEEVRLFTISAVEFLCLGPMVNA